MTVVKRRKVAVKRKAGEHSADLMIFSTFIKTN
jgi:hypothetical protein